MAILRCDHCLLDFPERDAVYDDEEGNRRVFCCNGCLGIYRLIRQEKLERFYERRNWEGAGVPSQSIGKKIDIARFAGSVRETERDSEIDIAIEGIRCSSCVWLTEKILARTEGVDYAQVNYVTHRARIRWDPQIVGLEKILQRIQSIGYDPKPWSESEQYRTKRAETRDLFVRFGTAAFLSSQLMMYSAALYAGYFQGIDLRTKAFIETVALVLTIPVIFYSGRPFISNTISGLKRLHFTMDSLITMGAGSAFLYSIYSLLAGSEVYFDTTAMIITLILLGRLIEATAKRKASETIERLAGLSPMDAMIIGGSGEKNKVPIDSIKKGDLVSVAPGERVPLDGVVRGGGSEVDESIITGESRPVSKHEGSPVIGGSMNLYGSFVFEVTATGKETALARIIRAVEDAQASKPRIQAAADRVVGYFVPSVLLLAASAMLFHLLRGASVNLALMSGISVLVIACPCSLGLATPLAVLIFTTMASARGILIKDGQTADNAGRIDRVVFDKTGTITLGRTMLRETVILDSFLDRDHVLVLAGAIESLSEHSIGRAISGAAKMVSTGSMPPAVSGFLAVPGKGVTGIIDGKRIVIGNRSIMSENGITPGNAALLSGITEPFEKAGDTVVYVGWEGTLRALMVISDAVRDDTYAVIAELRDMGCDVSILSGDNVLTTGAIAGLVNVGHAFSELSPVSKKEVIEDMQRKGAGVMVVGDGINDAPALTQATVGVAMGRGTEIAIESADAVLIRDDLSLIPYFIRLSRKTFSIIRQNIFWAFFYNILFVPLAFAGLLHPIVAAAAMAASSLFVVANSLRIKRVGKTEHLHFWKGAGAHAPSPPRGGDQDYLPPLRGGIEGG